MLGLGFSECALLMLVMLILLGPKELMTLMHRTGRMLGFMQKKMSSLKKILLSDE